MNLTLPTTVTRRSPYLPAVGRIEQVRALSPLEKLFTIQLPDGQSLNHAPGQFVELSLFGTGEAPFSISSSPSRSNGTFELCIRRAGRLTTSLHELEAGDCLGVRGPYGRGFPLQQFRGMDLLILPGGLGLAPLRSVINEVIDHRYEFGRLIILYGARSPSELLFQNELAEWQERGDVEMSLTVDRADENWQGHVGVITTLIPALELDVANTIAMTVGPPVMYRFVIMELLAKGLREANIWLGLERRMKCGVGKCGHCQINHLFACIDGPCFPYAQIKRVEEAL